MPELTLSEQKVLTGLLAKAGQICSRDEIAQFLWGKNWVEKYSDWMIDTIIYRLRHKLPAGQEIKTLRNQGYALRKQGYEAVKNTGAAQLLKPVPGIQATEKYLTYMNNPDKVRKVLKDLFEAVKQAGLVKYLHGRPACADRLLVINSYSFDNVDAVKDWQGEVIFSHFDERALDLHRRRAEELGLKNIKVLYDDIRQSRLADRAFNTVINDFRFNFNTDHQQNRQMAGEMRRVLRPKGTAFVSAVTGRRKRWFMAEEQLARLAYPLDYYRQLFRAAGFKIVKEFDREEGEKWYKKLAGVRPGKEPVYSRFLLSA